MFISIKNDGYIEGPMYRVYKYILEDTAFTKNIKVLNTGLFESSRTIIEHIIKDCTGNPAANIVRYINTFEQIYFIGIKPDRIIYDLVIEKFPELKEDLDKYLILK